MADYNGRAKLGESEACQSALRDALGFLARYYAAVCVAACRELGCLPGDLALEWKGAPSLSQAVPTLNRCLERLEGRPERLARKLRSVFHSRDGLRPWAEQALLEDPGVNPVLRFCARAGHCELEQVLGAARLLDAWIEASFGFFLESEQRVEPGAFFGRTEQVVQFQQYTLHTGLTMRLREARSAPPSAILIPQAQALAGSPPAQAAEPLSAQADELSPAIAAQAPEATAPALPLPQVVRLPFLVSPAGPVPAPAVPGDVQAAGGLQAFLRTRKDENAGEARPDPRPSAPEEGPSFSVKLEPHGMVRGGDGRFGWGGHLWVTSDDDRELSGSVVAANAEVELKGARFAEPRNRVAYWIDTQELAHSSGFLEVRVANQVRRYGIWKLAPASRFSQVARPRLAAYLLLPSLLGVGYACWVLSRSYGQVEDQLRETLGDSFDAHFRPGQPLSLHGQGVGQLDVTVLPRVQSATTIFMLVAWLVPVVNARLFARFSLRDQRALLPWLALACGVPTLLFALLGGTPLAQGPLTRHPQLAGLDFRHHLLSFALLNAAATVYVLASQSGRLHARLNALGRSALALGLALGALAVVIWEVSRRPW